MAMYSTQAELISLGKNFSDVEGKDVVQLLQLAINKLEVGICGMSDPGWGGYPCGAVDSALALLLASSTM